MKTEYPPFAVHKRTSDQTFWSQLGGEWVEVHTRKEFFANRFNYEYGDHLLAIGPTQLAGKTRLMIDALASVDTSGLNHPPVMLIAKPSDPTIRAGISRLGYQIISEWPPKKRLFTPPPAGYAFWPPHLREATSRQDSAHIAAKFHPAVHELFWKENTILVVDELYNFVALLRKGDDVDRHLTQGDGMGSALWSGTQKPSGTQRGALSGFTFNSATHTFITRDPVTGNRKRMSEISGVRPEIVEHALWVLPPYWWLYIHRNGPKICLVRAGR